jgi:hypothetical protein
MGLTSSTIPITMFGRGSVAERWRLFAPSVGRHNLARVGNINLMECLLSRSDSGDWIEPD